MSQPVFTAIVVVEEMPERWRLDYPVLSIREFNDSHDARNWCDNFIKSPVAGGPTEPYKMRWSILFGVEMSNGTQETG